MRSEQERDEISAYLDGESEQPEAVERLLQTDQETAAYLNQLRQASGQVRALPSPDVHPAFLARVMAGVAEIDAQRHRHRRWRFPLALCTAAMVLIMTGVSVFYVGSGEQPPSLPESAALQNPPQDVLLVTVLEEHMLENGTELPLVFAPEPSWQEATLADEEVELLDAMDSMLTASLELRLMLSEMDAMEGAAFYELLTEYYAGDHSI